MLTRLEVSGFKNLRDVTVDFGPFTCIAGENGVGKSNIFDAIEFLASLADVSFGEAARNLRGAGGPRIGDFRDIFWHGSEPECGDIHLAAEMLVPAQSEDDLGSPAIASTTFLRYELDLGLESDGDPQSGRIRLNREVLVHITKGQAAQHLRFPHSAKEFRQAVVQGKRGGGPFLSTIHRDDGQLVVNVHGDGGSFGRPQPRSADRTNRTILSTIVTNENPTALVARREMQSWKRLSLEPSAMRSPDPFTAPHSMGPNGSHIAATLWRIAHSPDGDGPAAVYSRVAGRLSDLLGARVAAVTVMRDEVQQVFTLYVDEGGGRKLPARGLSEGTLRFLALCVLLEDPHLGGLICMEEPENGIHPTNLSAMVELIKDLAVDASIAPDADNPLRQVIVNTHSPGVVQLCDPEELVFVQSSAGAGGVTLYGFESTWRARAGSPTFGRLEALPYLTPPAGAQLQLPLELTV